ncbi:MAG TPA: hypothetical protein VGD54_16510 [Steroidobacteraceae bacterium]
MQDWRLVRAMAQRRDCRVGQSQAAYFNVYLRVVSLFNKGRRAMAIGIAAPMWAVKDSG